MKHGLHIFVLLLLSFLPMVPYLHAQDGSFTVSATPTTVSAGDQFQVTYTLTGNDVNNVGNLKVLNFTQFVVISGPSQSTNMQWINGQVSASITYTYILYARQPGKYTVGPATVDYKGKTLQTNSIIIEVTQGKPKPQKQQDQATEVNVGDNLIIKAIADKYHVRLGEQLTVYFKLYTRVSVTGYDLAKAPAFEGFWSEDFDMPKQPVMTNETIDGKQYRTVTIKKTALFATQAGQLKIAPLEIRCAVQMQTKRRSNDPFDSFFNDPFFQQVQTVNMDFKSNPLTIVVDPIPANAPTGFSGAIGHFSFESSIDKNKVKAGDAITLRLSVLGTGNIKLVTLPRPQLPADIESYEPKISEDILRDGTIIRGKKVAEYLLIPRNPGKRVIESMIFAYYDLDRREYMSLHSSRFEFTILPGKDFSTSGLAIADKENVRLLGEDIRYIKLSLGSLQRIEDRNSNMLFFVGLLLPPFIFVFAWVYRKRMERIYGDMPKLLFETAGREANKRLKKARVLFNQGNAESYYQEIIIALTEYLVHKLRTSKATFSLEQALSDLKNHAVTDSVLQKLKFSMERAEYARYAPGSDSAEVRKELLDAASDAIQGIESSFRKHIIRTPSERREL